MFAVVASSALAQDFNDQDRYGKSVDQVIAMGRTQWHDWYTDDKRAGGSTAGESFAEMIYADCLKVKNNAWLRMAKDPKSQLITELDLSFDGLLSDCVLAGRSLTGGGSMWNIIGSAAQATRQETVRNLIWPDSGPSARTSQDEVWAALKSATKALRDHKSDIEATADTGGSTFDDAMKALYRVNDNFNAVIAKVKSQDKPFKSRVFSFYKHSIGLVTLGV